MWQSVCELVYLITQHRNTVDHPAKNEMKSIALKAEWGSFYIATNESADFHLNDVNVTISEFAESSNRSAIFSTVSSISKSFLNDILKRKKNEIFNFSHKYQRNTTRPSS